jgi:hypothetical protein
MHDGPFPTEVTRDWIEENFATTHLKNLFGRRTFSPYPLCAPGDPIDYLEHGALFLCVLN